MSLPEVTFLYRYEFQEEVLKWMEGNGVQPLNSTYDILIATHAKVGNVARSFELCDEMVQKVMFICS